MYRALYDFTGTSRKYLSFHKDDQFTIISTAQKDWFLAQNGFGEIGYVPRNYVARMNTQFSEVLNSIDRAIEAINHQIRTGACSEIQRSNLEKLHQHRRSVIEDFEGKLREKENVPASTVTFPTARFDGSLTKTDSIHSLPAMKLHSTTSSFDSSKSSPKQSPTSPTSSFSRSSARRKAPSPPKLKESPTDNKIFDTVNQLRNSHLTKHDATSQTNANLTTHVITQSENIVHPGSSVQQEVPKSEDVEDYETVQEQEAINESLMSVLNKQDLEDKLHKILLSRTRSSEPSAEITVRTEDQLNEMVSSQSRSSQPSAELTVSTEDQLKEMVSSQTKNPQPSADLTVSTEEYIMNKSILSPIRSNKSFPNSPSRHFDAPSMINLSSLPVPSRLFADLVEEIRHQTGVSHDNSCLAVGVTLRHIGSAIPQVANLMDRIMFTFTEQGDEAEEEDTGYDATRLRYLFSEISTLKDDSQQRSWALHEDQKIIQGYLDEIFSILDNAKPSVCRRAVSMDSFTSVYTLVEYFQMETRTALRISLLHIFGVLCELEAAVISHLMYSVLPLELVSDILHNSQDVQRLKCVTVVLTMITCTGESFPTSLEDHVDEKFVEVIFDLIEKPPSEEHSDETTDALLNLILSLNLHYQTFGDANDNRIMKVIKQKEALPRFTEKLVVLFNRGDDPCKMFPHQTPHTHSVIKFFMDIYNNPSTANLLYTNDARVLVDILIRQLSDLQPGNQIRSLILSLTLLLVTNSDYLEDKHRIEELILCLNHILNEDWDTMTDKAVAKEIIDFLS